MDLKVVSHGFGILVPFQIHKLDAVGQPTPEVVLIRKESQLTQNLRATNSVIPMTEWPATATLPNGEPGNQFVYVTFSRPINVDSVLDASVAAGTNSQLTGAIAVLALDPNNNGATTPIKGRAFIDGKTYAGAPTNGLYPLERWIKNTNGKPEAVDVNGAFPGLGFPGTQSATGFAGDEELTNVSTFVFVVDNDGDLATHETFQANRQIRIVCTTAVRSKDGEALANQVIGSATVGPDTLAPEVLTTPPPVAVPDTDPSFNQQDVDPLTNITVRFTEPIQPLTYGPVPTGKPPALSNAATITFGPSAATVQVPFTISPISIYDFSSWTMKPSFNFPGAGPATAQCGTFNKVTLSVQSQQFADLANPNGAGGNKNVLLASTFFFTGEGPGLVNAPVAPGAIVIGRVGSATTAGLSVIDLNGFGQSTGNPSFDFTYQSFPPGNTNFPNNPNLKLQGSIIRPPMTPGTCTFDGGSSGVFSLTKDSSLNDLVLRQPLVESVGDMMIGWPLDVVYNNGQEPTGCQAGGGNLCAITGLKQVLTVFATSQTVGPPTTGQIPAGFLDGGPNPISWEPAPNPPGLVFPPLCVSPYLGGQEPTSIESATLLALNNLLVPGGSPTGDPLNGVPPSSPLAKLQDAFFVGPSLPGQPITSCLLYQQRQQVGHFLYLIDRGRREVVVVNSNRMTVLERIPLPDPTELAIAPNLDYLAVTNLNADQVSFIDINPTSSNFHRIVKTTTVGHGPRGIAWDPGNEDILVCCELEGSLSILSAFDFNVRKIVSNNLSQPFDVCITQRQQGFGFLRNVYFGWILNRNGRVAVFESGPNGVNGWGYDDVIGVVNTTFDKPKKIEIDFNNIAGSFWVLHENRLLPDGTQSNVPGGAVTNMFIESAIFGIIPLNVNSLFIPQFRDMSFAVGLSVGPEQLTGIPVDLATDDMANLGATANLFPLQSAGFPIAINGKSYVRATPTGAAPSKTPNFLFLAVPNSSQGTGVIDVISNVGGIRQDTNPYLPGVQSVPCPGATFLVDYWQQ